MAKYIAHASIDERGKIADGSAGDQTKREVCIRTMYYKPWSHYLELIDEAVRIEFGNIMIDIANNDNIGYDQNGRNTLLTEAEKVGFDVTKIKTKCECDCSSAVTIAILIAIYRVHGEAAYKAAYKVLVVSGNCSTTRSLRNRLDKLNMIKFYTAKTYVEGTSKAKFGGIYIKEGSHVVCYINDGKKVAKEQLTVDGDWGQKTTKLSQKVFGTTQDGIISNQSFGCVEYLVNCSTSSWKFNDSGRGSNLIKSIQRFLKDLGYYTGSIDGLCGKNTIKAIQKFLKAQKLYTGRIDGKMGPGTVSGWQMYINSRL